MLPVLINRMIFNMNISHIYTYATLLFKYIHNIYWHTRNNNNHYSISYLVDTNGIKTSIMKKLLYIVCEFVVRCWFDSTRKIIIIKLAQMLSISFIFTYKPMIWLWLRRQLSHHFSDFNLRYYSQYVPNSDKEKLFFVGKLSLSSALSAHPMLFRKITGFLFFSMQ